jgi:hypothetical protein
MDVICHDHKGMEAIMPQLASSSFDHYGDAFRQGPLFSISQMATFIHVWPFRVKQIGFHRARNKNHRPSLQFSRAFRMILNFACALGTCGADYLKADPSVDFFARESS